jgi:hypothetical protein
LEIEDAMAYSKAPTVWPSGNTGLAVQRPRLQTIGALPIVERLAMDFAKLCEYLTPTTLAGVVVDLGNGPFPEDDADADSDAVQLEQAQVIAMDALVANIGETEAKSLIEELEDES